MRIGKSANTPPLISCRLISAIVALVFLFQAQACLAQEISYNPVTKSAEAAIGFVPNALPNQTLANAPLIPAHKIKSAPAKFEFYQFDPSPLGDRAPLLLVHGLLGEYHPLFRWKELATYLNADQNFQQRYKIYLLDFGKVQYLARFKTQTSLSDMTESFKQGMRQLPKNKPLTIVAISMSCQVIRNGMRDPEVNQRIAKVITLGGFFRGSPLFCSNWVKKSLDERHPSPIYRFDRYLGYKLYFSLHKDLLRDFVWDNVDGQMPPSIVQSKPPDLEPTSFTETPIKRVTAEKQPGDEKFYVYTGYLHNLHTRPLTKGERVVFHNPITFLRTTLPTHFGRERPVLRYLNELIAETVPKTEENKNFVYTLNDGISPIASGLLLSDDFIAHSTLSEKQDLTDIRANSYAKRARIFDNVDHLSYIQGNRRFRPAPQVSDVLTPNEKARPIFSWILGDILDRSETPSQHLSLSDSALH